MNARAALLLGFALASLPAIPACATPATERTRILPSATGRSEEEIHRLGEEGGVHNMAEVAPGLLRGSTPVGERSFAMLAGLGVKSILSVDGARPDVEGAARHGIRYYHVPMEYSGVTREEQRKIAAVAREADGNLFVHCHHGKHRGVAACEIAWMSRDGATAEQAVADMRKGGTDPGYRGLYDDVRNFRPFTAEEIASVRAADIPAAARTPDLVEAMVAVDGTFDRMKEVKRSGWKTPEGMPDVTPAHEARILAERFRELARLDEAKGKPVDFRGWLEGAEKAAWDIEKAIQAGDGEGAGKAMDAVTASCAACHRVYRNNR